MANVEPTNEQAPGHEKPKERVRVKCKCGADAVSVVETKDGSWGECGRCGDRRLVAAIKELFDTGRC